MFVILPNLSKLTFENNKIDSIRKKNDLLKRFLNETVLVRVKTFKEIKFIKIYFSKANFQIIILNFIFCFFIYFACSFLKKLNIFHKIVNENEKRNKTVY